MTTSRNARRSRRKGAQTERDLVNTLKANGIEAQRIHGSGSHADGHNDVEAKTRLGRKEFECKHRANGFKQIHEWKPDDAYLVIRADRKPPLFVLSLEEFLELVK